MKKLISLFLLSGSLAAAPNCAPELKPALDILYRSTDARKLIERVEKEGNITIYQASFNGGSNAMWKSDERAIVINANRQNSYSQIARSILFEFHNALATEEFAHLDRHAWNQEISKKAYIEATERLEHQNALKTAAIIEKGIRKGVFPQDMYWPITKDFDRHFQIQKESGHSQGIAASYDYLVNYNKLRYMAWRSRNKN